MWKPCGLYLQKISRIQSLLITSTVTILVKPPLSLAWMCTIVSSLDPCLLPCHTFPTPQFLLNNSSHLVPYQPASYHAPPQLSTLQWLPIWQRIKAKVLAVASKAPFGLAPPNSSFHPLLLPASPLTSPSTLVGLDQARHTLPQAFSLAAPSPRTVLPSYQYIHTAGFLTLSAFVQTSLSQWSQLWPSYLNCSAHLPLFISHILFYCCSTALTTNCIIYYLLCLLSRLHCQNLALRG